MHCQFIGSNEKHARTIIASVVLSRGVRGARGWNENHRALPRIVLLFVDLASMRDPQDTHQLHRFIDEVHHTPVPDPNPPLIPKPLQLPANDSSFRTTLASTGSGRASSSFRAAGLTSTEYLVTQPPMFDQVSFDLFERNAFLFAARFSNQSIPKVF